MTAAASGPATVVAVLLVDAGTLSYAIIVATATTRSENLEQPFIRWSLRKPAAYLAKNPSRVVRAGRERQRQFLRKRPVRVYLILSSVHRTATSSTS
jgi:hypothetical protein